MRKLKPKFGEVSVVHLRTEDVVKKSQNTIRLDSLSVKRDDYSVSSYFLVNNVEWVIESKCMVFDNGHIYKATGKPLQYNEETHKNLVHLIHIQAHDVFNALIGRNYDNAEIGMEGNDYDHTAIASGSITQNRIEISYAQNSQYFKIGEQFKPFFNLWLREW